MGACVAMLPLIAGGCVASHAPDAVKVEIIMMLKVGSLVVQVAHD